MNNYLKIALFVFFAIYSGNSFALPYPNEPRTFRGLEIGSKIDAAKAGLTQINTKESYSTYINKNDDLSLFGLKVDSILYVVHAQKYKRGTDTPRLYLIKIGSFRITDFDALLGKMENTFGKPTKVFNADDPNCSKDCQKHTNLLWDGDAVNTIMVITYQLNSNNPEGLHIIIYDKGTESLIKLENERKKQLEAESAAKQKQKNEGF